MNRETRRKIDRGEWWDGELDEWLQTARETWDDADRTGQFELVFDAADLYKILTELKARRDSEHD